MKSRHRISLAVVAGCIAHAGSTRPATADPGDACVTAYEQSQQLRRGGKLLRARAELRLCQRACPTMLTQDCDRWLGEVDASIPTVVLSAKDPDGKALASVRVLVDGAPLVEAVDARPVEVDPGQHAFRFEHGASSVETKATLRERERGRPVGVTFAPDAIAAPAEGPPTIAFVLGGAGIAALGVGAVLGIKGQVDRSDLESTGCAPFCNKGKVADIRTEWWIAGVAAGVGAAALGAAVFLYLSAPSEPARAVATRRSVSFELGPALGGGFARVTHSF